MAAGGAIPATRDFLEKLRSLCTEHGVILIFDEVVSSRLAMGGMQSVHKVTPDMTTLGKYLAGGLSFGAFGGRADIMDRLDMSPAGHFKFPRVGSVKLLHPQGRTDVDLLV